MTFPQFLAWAGGLTLFSALCGWLAFNWARHVLFARRERYFKTSWLLNRGISGSTADYEPGWFGTGLVYVSLLAVVTGSLALAGLATLVFGIFQAVR